MTELEPSENPSSDRLVIRIKIIQPSTPFPPDLAKELKKGILAPSHKSLQAESLLGPATFPQPEFVMGATELIPQTHIRRLLKQQRKTQSQQSSSSSSSFTIRKRGKWGAGGIYQMDDEEYDNLLEKLKMMPPPPPDTPSTSTPEENKKADDDDPVLLIRTASGLKKVPLQKTAILVLQLSEAEIKDLIGD